jgi:hypothetical protein
MFIIKESLPGVTLTETATDEQSEKQLMAIFAFVVAVILFVCIGRTLKWF